MSELRQNPLTGEWVIIAPERGARPHAFDRFARRGATSLANCPFCPGNEHETPPEVARKGDGAWTIRVVPNKYPALSLPHEVIIESARHGALIGDLPHESVVEILDVHRQRYTTHAANRDVKYISIFKNDGVGSGQSIDHLHSQLIALATIPERAKREADGFKRAKRCPHCAVIESSDSCITANDAFALVAPPASRFAYELAIIPIDHEQSFATMTAAAIDSLARMLQLAMSAVNHRLSRPPYNWVLKNAFPRVEHRMKRFHWSIEITPRLAQLGGFELATGMYINIVAPETAAAELREALSEHGSPSTEHHR